MNGYEKVMSPGQTGSRGGIVVLFLKGVGSTDKYTSCRQ